MNIKADFENSKIAFKIVFSEKKYYFITIFVALAIIFFLNFAINFELVTNNIFSNSGIGEKLTLILGLFQGTFTNNTPQTLLGITIVGLLAGINTSFIVYKYLLERKISKREGLESAFGTFLGIFAGGCASCALSVAALLGVTSSLAFFPFGGSELVIIGIIILIFSVFSASKSVLGLCNIDIKK
ncbi:MAG TPA: hypothetical protein VFF13_04330 [archaeon]|nr:hypothetical protein [archaeon]